MVDVRDERLDKFLASRETDLSRAQIAGLVAGGLVKVDGAIVKSSYRLRGGETVEMEMLPPPPYRRVSSGNTALGDIRGRRYSGDRQACGYGGASRAGTPPGHRRQRPPRPAAWH